ncbi:MAG TPA: glutamate synthase-related protein [Candidatus Dormibacteraeota bacterium]|nr:glutamate synthase-related protein [Candidatus Dormibacteraeota bacterium]
MAVVRKDARAAASVLAETLRGLEQLEHRSGIVDGEGDGSGVLTDIPRALWADVLFDAGEQRSLARDRRFAVGHFFVPKVDDELAEEAVRRILARHGLSLLAERHGTTDASALGARGRLEEPRFWQVALLSTRGGAPSRRALLEAAAEIEHETAATVVSLSTSSAVYKLRGSARQLPLYFRDLADARFRTSMAFGHNRYSTNTTSTFARVQPFAAFAHNGEINTIARLREEARSLGLPLSRDGSDSQDVDAVLRAMVYRLSLHPIEAVELLFPPIVNEVSRMDAALQDAYVQARAAFGPYAQGPAAFLARVDDVCLFGVDALGLRPLWHVETVEAHVFASERGFIAPERYVADPRPLGPGEHVALERARGAWRLVDEAELRRRFLAARQARGTDIDGARTHLACGGPTEPLPNAGTIRGVRGGTAARWEVDVPPDEVEDVSVRREQQFAAFGFEPDDLKMAAFMAQTANEPIGSLGYDGPLAALSERRPNLADHLHETVAVVTNPAIDREREIEHFSTRVVLGPRPSVNRAYDARPWLELRHPILLGGHAPETGLSGADHRATAATLGTWIVEDVVQRFALDAARAPVILEADRDWEEHPRDALARLAADACRAVRAGARLVLVHDRHVFDEGRAWLDPLLVVAAAHRALVAQESKNGSLRREAALVVSAGSLRNLHDVMAALALGADATNPYLLLEYAISSGDPDALANLVEALRKGVEKVISTLGVHELRGYGRQMSAIGVAKDVASLLGMRTFVSTGEAGLTWQRIGADGFERASVLRERTPARLEPAFRLYPRIWKAANAVANGEAPYASYAEKLAQFERTHPIALRHLLDFRTAHTSSAGSWPRANTRAGEHDAPFYISSMSFGSQGEVAYRAYAEAMARMNLLCINGEGGELPDLIGRYPRNRGQQIASGRFGVSALLANSSNYLEIKIGQGAKPGEGGHLPGRKVSAKVALARNARAGVDLISPSNNHDIYSIEDLAQVVHELKVVNPRAKVAVKIPVTPDVGIIAVGVAKAGADIVTVSGYDGGTGAARQHALRRAGLPAELGVGEAHRALVAAGLRDRVELWCDGGMKSAVDVAKMLCLGADRVGFATLAMVAIGCTICRGCQLDTCHVGIATQIETRAEAEERGLKKFDPQELDRAVANLMRFFGALRDDLARIVASLGVRSTRLLVGRVDLLEQTRGLERVDLSALLAPVEGDWRRATERIPLFVAAEAAVATESRLDARERFVATSDAGALARARIANAQRDDVVARFAHGSVAGNGFAAYATDGVRLSLAGGAQDGAAKTALGGAVAVLKTRNANGAFVDGAVGKCFAYGAQRGRFYVQGSADARAGIRLSGADVVIGGDVKGFAFEYMTGGTAVVLGDPGRWICSGMTGGAVFVRHDPGRGLDEAAIRDRVAKGAKIVVREPNAEDLAALRTLLVGYAATLRDSGQDAAAVEVEALLAAPTENFRAIRSQGDVVDQRISTE